MVVPGGMISVAHDFPGDPGYPNQTGYYNLDMFITITKEPTVTSYYFWAMQFWFHSGNGGYMGLQTGATLANKENRKIAIFSIWDALEAKPSNVEDAEAGTFGGEGVGYNCKIPYEWQEGTEYRLRLFEIADARYPDQPEWWGAWVMDMTTNDETFIGKIKVPANWSWMKGNTNFFVEYYLSVPSCSQIPHAKATLDPPTRENGRILPVGPPAVKTYGNCQANASVAVGTNNEVFCKTG